MSRKLRVVVTGATGKMSQEAARAILDQPDMALVGAVSHSRGGDDLGPIIGRGSLGWALAPSLSALLDKTGADVLVDFTRAEAARENIAVALSHGVRPVVGTTGLSQAELDGIDSRCRGLGLGAVVCPNFSIGAMLLARFAREAAACLPDVEIIELHHETKVDAPSGTALRLREGIDEAIGAGLRRPTPIHSLRLPGLVAHHRVIFGGPGELLTLSHDSLSRQSFMPSLMQAVRAVMTFTGLVADLAVLLEKGKRP
ncbi:MAG: 4-hydroxy-tetrahydrodipicolinate reductase [Bacillota bacterium]